MADSMTFTTRLMDILLPIVDQVEQLMIEEAMNESGVELTDDFDRVKAEALESVRSVPLTHLEAWCDDESQDRAAQLVALCAAYGVLLERKAELGGGGPREDA